VEGVNGMKDRLHRSFIPLTLSIIELASVTSKKAS
jgi:hypothetical protein